MNTSVNVARAFSGMPATFTPFEASVRRAHQADGVTHSMAVAAPRGGGRLRNAPDTGRARVLAL